MPFAWQCCSLLFFLLSLSSRSRGTSTCPQACTCGTEWVRCDSGLTMREIPRDLPHGDTLSSLTITRGNITSLNTSSFAHLPHLTALDLHNNGIEILANGTFRDLTQLHTLVLRRNFLKHLSDDTFLGLQDLRVLDLSWNCFAELHGRWFQPLTGLHVLDLARNVIELIENEAFVGLAQLQVLNLTRNRMMRVSHDYMAPLSALATLVLDDNSIRVIEGDSFSSQPALTRLSLTGNRDLRSVQAGAFVSRSQLLQLKELSLKGTHLTEVPVATLKSLPNLQTLDLSQTAIGTLRGRAFIAQRHLLNLTLDSLPELTTIEAHAFAGLTRLETLVISNNQLLSNVSWAVFRNLSSLRYLDLHNNGLETVRSGQADWQDIEVVDLRGNPLRCDCHAAWMLTLLEDGDNESAGGGNNTSPSSPSLPANATCTEDASSTKAGGLPPPSGGAGDSAVSTAAFTRQVRCHMPPHLHARCLASLSAQQFRCPRRGPAPRAGSLHDDRRLTVALVSAGLTCLFLLVCGLTLKFRRRVCSLCRRQYRYRAHRSHLNGSSPANDNDIVDLETTQLEDFDSDVDTNVRP
ncbi:uncharacterized protein LOC143288926 [Babylonia areolata]|uniref:uncharacterized protein LOC143288926 n=1 Tax=Babylonia areolata TaxID=304850 RepID=UPI003FD22EF0